MSMLLCIGILECLHYVTLCYAFMQSQAFRFPPDFHVWNNTTALAECLFVYLPGYIVLLYSTTYLVA